MPISANDVLKEWKPFFLFRFCHEYMVLEAYLHIKQIWPIYPLKDWRNQAKIVKGVTIADLGGV